VGRAPDGELFPIVSGVVVRISIDPLFIRYTP